MATIVTRADALEVAGREVDARELVRRAAADGLPTREGAEAIERDVREPCLALRAYDMATGKKVHHDITPYVFHSWNRHGDVVIMSGELEVAGYTLDGTKLWASVVESPWDYTVNGDRMHTIVMGHRVEFPLREGPGDERLVARPTG